MEVRPDAEQEAALKVWGTSSRALTPRCTEETIRAAFMLTFRKCSISFSHARLTTLGVKQFDGKDLN